MKTSAKSSTRLGPRALCALLPIALFTAFAVYAFAQSGGAYTVNPSVAPGGGGSSSNAGARIEGSIGQSILGISSGSLYTLNAGFWPNAVTCPFALSPAAQLFTMRGGQGGIKVLAPAYCSWNVTTADSWIVITSADSGTGNDAVTFEVRENFTGSARQGAITVTGLRYRVVQDAGLGEDCNYSISPQFQAFSPTGGTGFVSLLADSNCAWQAHTADEWIKITSRNVGIGNATLTYSVGANPGPSGRNGTIVIAGKLYTVKQKGS